MSLLFSELGILKSIVFLRLDIRSSYIEYVSCVSYSTQFLDYLSPKITIGIYKLFNILKIVCLFIS